MHLENAPDAGTDAGHSCKFMRQPVCFTTCLMAWGVQYHINTTQCPCAGAIKTTEASNTTTTRVGFEQRVSEFTLPNGLKFIVLERPVAAIVSCHTYVNVGAFDEKDGESGE